MIELLHDLGLWITVVVARVPEDYHRRFIINLLQIIFFYVEKDLAIIGDTQSDLCLNFVDCLFNGVIIKNIGNLYKSINKGEASDICNDVI